MIEWKNISRGSKNPPVNKQILLKANDGTVGIGCAFKCCKSVYFDYHSYDDLGRMWMGSPKLSFAAWAEID